MEKEKLTIRKTRRQLQLFDLERIEFPLIPDVSFWKLDDFVVQAEIIFDTRRIVIGRENAAMET